MAGMDFVFLIVKFVSGLWYDHMDSDLNYIEMRIQNLEGKLIVILFWKKSLF